MNNINFMTNNITFTSKIRVVGADGFEKVLYPININLHKHCAGYPWTIKQSVYSDDVVYTRDVYSCSACLIKDRTHNKALLMHLCPENYENLNFRKLFGYIKKKVDIGKSNLQAFLIGSNGSSEESLYLFDELYNFLSENNIPTTKFRHSQLGASVAYDAKTDEIFVLLKNGIQVIQPLHNANFDFLKRAFRDVSVCNFDEVI